MKKTYLIFHLLICLLSFSISIFTQNTIIDSLKNELRIHTTKDTTRIKLLNSLTYDLYTIDLEATQKLIDESEHLLDSIDFKPGAAELLYFKGYIEVMKSDYDKAIDFTNQALLIYQNLNNNKGVSYSLSRIGVAYYYQGDFSKAIEYFEKSAEMDTKRNDLKGVSSSLDNIGNIYADQGKFDEAILNYNKSMVIKIEIEDSLGMALFYNNIGSIYIEQSDFPKALENFNKALNIYIKTNNEIATTGLLRNLAMIYQNQKKYDQALLYYKKSLKICKKQHNKRGIANCLNGIGYVYKEQNKNKKALNIFKETLAINKDINNQRGIAETMIHIADMQVILKQESIALNYYNQALKINKDIGVPIGECWSYLGITTIYVNNKQFKKALIYALKSEEIAVKFDFIDLQKAAKEFLSIIYESLGDYKNSFLSHQQFKVLNDSLLNEETIKKMTQLEYEYKYQEELETANIRELKLTKTVKTTINNLEKSQQNLLIGVITFLSITLILVSIIFFLRLRNEKSKSQNIIIEQKLLRSQMTPHFIFNALSVLQGIILNKEEKKSIQYLSKFSKLLRITLENSREKLVHLSQEVIAIENYIAIQKLENNSYDSSVIVDNSVDITLFKIPPMLIQPFVENALEHAFINQPINKTIVVHLSYLNKNLVCTITDNGVGINSIKREKNRQKKSLATKITTERIKVLSKDFNVKGSITIEDRQKYNKKGTIVTLVIPHKIETVL